jgi:hypothetical protein
LDASSQGFGLVEARHQDRQLAIAIGGSLLHRYG